MSLVYRYVFITYLISLKVREILDQIIEQKGKES